MKIKQLKIQNLRGIIDLPLTPSGDNLVIIGPNGSGKSGVVDAIDFLLTGDIRRLKGTGTGGLRFKDHGHHVDSDPKDAVVSAVVLLDNPTVEVEVTRRADDPNTLHVEESYRSRLEPILQVASRQQHMLSRREILRFIFTEPAKRAELIQELLDLKIVEDRRGAVVGAKGVALEEENAAKRNLEGAQQRLTEAAGLDIYDPQEILNAINGYRQQLDGTVMRAIGKNIVTGIAPPSSTASSSLNPDLIQGAFKRLTKAIESLKIGNEGGIPECLSKNVARISSDPNVADLAKRIQLFELGKELIGETGECPLCKTPWDPAELRSHVDTELASLGDLQKDVRAIREGCDAVRKAVATMRGALEQLITAAKELALLPHKIVLQAWLESLVKVSKAVDTPLQDDHSSLIVDNLIQNLELLAKRRTAGEAILRKAKEKTPAPSASQTAWDTLKLIQTRLGDGAATLKKQEEAELIRERAVLLETEYNDARDRVLDSLYAKIKDRFVHLYKAMHGSDESTFEAQLEPSGASMHFLVDFYKKGKYPPHAMHSEGHQDSMGLCLYLALAEHLNKDIIDLIVLDDVVMSIDSGHRRQVCRVLKQEFPSKQFIITTHERAWAGQLRTEGVVTGRNQIAFHGWTVETGPLTTEIEELWERARQEIESNQTEKAAHTLRYGLEGKYRQAAAALGGEIRYQLEERWGYGDFKPAAISRLTKLYTDAKKSAKSWGNSPVEKELDAIIQDFSDAKKKEGRESWQLHSNVHENPWADFQASELTELLDAHKQLWGFFECSGCEGLLEATKIDMQNVALKCACGSKNYNLKSKA